MNRLLLLLHRLLLLLHRVSNAAALIQDSNLRECDEFSILAHGNLLLVSEEGIAVLLHEHDGLGHGLFVALALHEDLVEEKRVQVREELKHHHDPEEGIIIWLVKAGLQTG